MLYRSLIFVLGLTRGMTSLLLKYRCDSRDEAYLLVGDHEATMGVDLRQHHRRPSPCRALLVRVLACIALIEHLEMLKAEDAVEQNARNARGA